MLLAQLTDTHIIEPGVDHDHLLDNIKRLEAAVEGLNGETLAPDAIVATGDLTDHGTEAEMKILADLLEPLQAPVLAIPGNHDVRETFTDCFDLPWASPTNLSWSLDVGEVRVIGLDTLVPESHGGRFDDERREWLDAALDDAAGRRTVLAMHHPPFLSGIGWMDEMSLDGREAFAEVVADRPHVDRILCGHLHRPMTTTIGGVTTTTGIATAQHIELDLAPGAPVGIICDPGGYQLHHLHDGRWVSHTRYIETGAEVVRPSWAD
ncbi:MAG: phosphodiesterase [Actinomycetota bacterium]